MPFSKIDGASELVPHESFILAVISNVFQPPVENPDFTFDLTAADITESDFLQLFFNFSTNHFNINQNNRFHDLLSLLNKSYISGANQIVPLNFMQLVLSCISAKNSVTANTVSQLSRFSAIQKAGKIQNLAQVCGFQKAFSWFEIIDLMSSSNVIAHSANPLAVAYAPLIVQFLYVDTDVNLTIALNYHFNVALPGYINPTPGLGPCHYSKDEASMKNQTPNKLTTNNAAKNKTLQESQKYSESGDDLESESDTYTLDLLTVSPSIVEQIQLIQKDNSSEDNDDASDEKSLTTESSGNQWV